MTTAASRRRPGRNLPDRETTARRLQNSSAERFYDPEVDLDWDAPLVEGKQFMPEHRVSLYGTHLWEQLTPEQRLELNKQESVAVASFGIYAEIGLMQGLLRSVQEGDPTTLHAQYALTEVADECRHSTMFARTIAKAGERPYRLPRPVVRIATVLTALLPLGPANFAGALFVEEPFDRWQRENMKDPNTQPHIRMVNRIHVTEEARHMTYARDEVLRGMPQLSRGKQALNRGIVALMAVGLKYTLIEPRAYRRVGLNPREAMKVALNNPNFQESVRWACERLVAFLDDAGFLRGRVTMALWRRSGLLATDWKETR